VLITDHESSTVIISLSLVPRKFRKFRKFDTFTGRLASTGQHERRRAALTWPAA
jgi:hypothetical protein